MSALAKTIAALAVLCMLLLAAELVIHKHGDIRWEEWFGFHGLFALVAGVVLVLGAAVLRALVRRPEDYYERR